MSTVKMPYYPGVQIESRLTRFGSPEISIPHLYDTALLGRIIIKVDLLESLRPLLGDNCLYARGRLYDFLSGNIGDDTRHQLVAHYYRVHKTVTVYVNELVTYGETTDSLMDDVHRQLMQRVNEYKDEAVDTLSSMGCKYLTQTHYFLYYASNSKREIPLRGVELIC